MIVVGPQLTTLEKVYVRVDSVQYELPSVIEALYFLFQLYIIFNISYPKESDNVCYAIQWAAMNIRMDSDVRIPFIYNTLNKLKLLQRLSAKKI